jgi:bifunctional non-homologous end joining protein LigD
MCRRTHILKVLRKIPFIAPMAPTLAKQPPAGPEWLHEVKFDGFRAQVHVESGSVTIYSRKGTDMTRRFRRLKDALVTIPTDSVIIDCELVACDESGQPDFRALMTNGKDCDLCLWAFDLLALDGVSVMDKPLFQRRTALNELLNEVDDQELQLSQNFPDPAKLLAAADRMGLEGIVSKRRDSTYRSGQSRDWIKVKTAAWREANRDRHELFEKKRS